MQAYSQTANDVDYDDGEGWKEYENCSIYGVLTFSHSFSLYIKMLKWKEMSNEGSRKNMSNTQAENERVWVVKEDLWCKSRSTLSFTLSMFTNFLPFKLIPHTNTHVSKWVCEFFYEENFISPQFILLTRVWKIFAWEYQEAGKKLKFTEGMKPCDVSQSSRFSWE